GGLLSQKLFRRSEYLEATMLDTRVTDPSLRQKLLEVFKENARTSIQQRLNTAGLWIKYLQRQEEQELVARKGCQLFGLPPIGPVLESSFARDQERIINSARRRGIKIPR